VRNLERCIGAIARSKAVEWAEFVDTEKKGGKQGYQNTVDAGDLEKILGIARWDPLEREREERRGLVYGLVVSGMGEGGVLPVESVMTSGPES
jgi:ATP-dependent Lon protease